MTDLTEPLTALQEVERRALVSERSDAVALHRFVSELEEIEACAEGTGD